MLAGNLPVRESLVPETMNQTNSQVRYRLTCKPAHEPRGQIASRHAPELLGLVLHGTPPARGTVKSWNGSHALARSKNMTPAKKGQLHAKRVEFRRAHEGARHKAKQTRMDPSTITTHRRPLSQKRHSDRSTSGKTGIRRRLVVGERRARDSRDSATRVFPRRRLSCIRSCERD